MPASTIQAIEPMSERVLRLCSTPGAAQGHTR